MKTTVPENYAVDSIENTPKEWRGRQAIAFLVSDLILIVLAYVSLNPWLTLLCVLLFAITAVRTIALLLEAIFCSELIEEEFGLRLDESQD